MKKWAKLVCLLLVTLTALSSFSACDNGEEKSTQPSESSVAEVITGEPDELSDLPDDVKFTGKKVSIMFYDKVGVADELYSAPGSTGNNVSSAVFSRNVAVEDRLGITLDVTPNADMGSQNNQVVDGLIRSGSDFHMVSYSTNDAIRDLIKGYFYDLTEVENLEISKKYWTQGFNDIVSHGPQGNQYLITGAPALSLYRYTFVTIYNKDYFGSVGWTDLYDVVKAKEWTLEYQNQLISEVHVEQDGIEGITEGDFVGFVTGDCVSVDPYLVACGIELVKKNSDGDWYWDNSEEERTSTMISRVRDIYKDSMGVFIYSSDSYDNTGLMYIADFFAAGQAAMATVQLHALEMKSGYMDFDYGIVPMPKYDSAQKDYYSYTQDQVTSFGILKTVNENDLPMVGATLDQLGFYSYHKVVPEYYGVSLSYKFLSNPESKEMLDLVFDSVKFDFIGAFSAMLSPAIRDQMRVFVYQEADNVVSSNFRSWNRSMQRQIDRDFNACFDTFE